MISVIYVSVADPLIREEDIAAILLSSRRNNAQAGLTGALIYNGHNFLQLLEGPPRAVDACLDTIRTDPRHSGMTEVRRRSIADRDFAEWTMLYNAEFEGDDEDLSRLTAHGRIDPQDERMLSNFIALGRRRRVG